MSVCHWLDKELELVLNIIQLIFVGCPQSYRQCYSIASHAIVRAVVSSPDHSHLGTRLEEQFNTPWIVELYYPWIHFAPHYYFNKGMRKSVHVSCEYQPVMESFSEGLLLEVFGRLTYDKLSSRGYVTLRKCAKLADEELRVMGFDNYFERRGLLSTFTGKGEEQAVRELLVSISNTELSTTSSSTFSSSLPVDQQWCTADIWKNK